MKKSTIWYFCMLLCIFILLFQNNFATEIIKKAPNSIIPDAIIKQAQANFDTPKVEDTITIEDKGVLGRIPDEIMPDNYMRRRIDVMEQVRGYSFERKGSVFDWRNAMPIGNGDIGAVVHGYPDNLTWRISKNDVWWNNIPPEHNEVYPPINLQEIRRRIREGDSSVRDSIHKEIQDSIRKHRYSGISTGRPGRTSCARFTLQLCRSANFYGPLKEKLDLERALAKSTFRAAEHTGSRMSGRVESFISRTDDVLVIRATYNDDYWGVVRFELSRDPMEPHKKAPLVTADEIDSLYQPKPSIQNGLAWFDMELRGEDAYTVALAADAPGVDTKVLGHDIFARGRTDKGVITFYISVVSNNDATDHAEEAMRRVKQARAIGWDKLLGRHEGWWADFWERSWVILPDSVNERPWYWGLYKAASARRPGKVCPAYAPPWAASNYPSWGFYIMTFENTRAVMGLLATNHAELMEPLISLLNDVREPLRPYVRKHFGIDGIAYPHSITSRGYPVMTKTLDGHQGLAPSGENMKYVWDYFDFTGDKDFLRRVGYPMIKDLATFYRNYLIEDDKGNLIVFPSHVLETATYSTNCIADISMIRLTLRNAARAADVLGVDADLAVDWRNALRRIPPYDTLPGGIWKICMGPVPERENFVLHNLYPISVGEEADAWHGSSTMHRQARANYEYYLGDQPDTWDFSLSNIAAARMGDREYAEKILSKYSSREGINKSTDDQSFSADISSALASEFITELMLQSHRGDIRLFPANPLDGDYAFHSLRARGAFLVSSEMRAGNVPYVLVKSLAGNTCNIVQPFGKGADVRVRDLESSQIIKEIDNANMDEIVTFETASQHIYVIERKDMPLDKVPMYNSNN